jgi:uncharacterized protein (DUF1697 family)
VPLLASRTVLRAVRQDADVPTHVALLRGINLGPHKRVAMPALRALVAGLGHTDVATYITSGNVVFTASGTRTADALGVGLEKAIAAEFGVSCRVVVLTCAELARVVADNPYPDEPDPKRVHAIFLTGTSGGEARAQLDKVRDRLGDKVGRDAAQIVGRTLYLHTPDGFGRSELAKVLSRPGGPAEGTARNWATVTKLAAMCQG